MSQTITTVIRCGDRARDIFATLASVDQQAGVRAEIILVTGASSPARLLPWLAEVAAGRGARTIHVPTRHPGAANNAGIRAAASPYVLRIDAGDRLASPCLRTITETLAADSSLDVITPAMRLLGAGGSSRVIVPVTASLDALIGSAEQDGAIIVRRDSCLALNGFDEELEDLIDHEFCLRTLQAGGRCATVERPLVIRSDRHDVLAGLSARQDVHEASMRRVVLKHAELFGRDPGLALYERERRLPARREENRLRLARRSSAMAELESLKARAVELRQLLPADQRDSVDLGDLHRTTPISRDWGYERGAPIDRHYIERFLEQHSGDIRGAVLEVQEPDYTIRFGGDRVTRSDVVDLDVSNPRATVISDLRCAANIPAGTYDCIILTQTLHVIDDMRAVVAECARILKPGGIVLATMPCASRVCVEYGQRGDFWRVTEAGAREVFAAGFAHDAIETQALGNVLVNTAFLYGLGSHELADAEFDATDPYFPMLVTVRAVKSANPTGRRPDRSHRGAETNDRAGQARPGAILLHHRIAVPSSDVHGLSISPQDFRAELTYLADHCRVMPLEELAAAASEGTVPPGAVALTFDDGYLDNLETAAPILEEFGMPATFFLTTERLDAGEHYEYWWDVLERALVAPGSALPSDLRLNLPGGERTFPTRTPEERLTAHGEIYRAIVAVSASVRDEVIGELARWSGRARPAQPEARRMMPEEIVQLAKRTGHAIGAHSHRHLMLPAQPISVRRDELVLCKTILEDLIGRAVPAFAYPFGAFDDVTVEAVREAGFTVAVVCGEAHLPLRADPLRLPRLEVTRGNIARLGAWLSDTRR